MVTQVDWSALKVTSKFLDSLGIRHMIIGEVAMMYYNSRSSPNKCFSIELAIDAEKLKEAEAAFKESFLFAELPAFSSIKSCYEGVAPYPKFQTTWLEPARTIILLPSTEFYDYSFLGSRVRRVGEQDEVYISEHIRDLTTTELFSLPFPQLLYFALSLLDCRLEASDHSAGHAARQLAKDMKLNKEWFKLTIQNLDHTDESCGWWCRPQILDMVKRMAEDQEKQDEYEKNHKRYLKNGCPGEYRVAEDEFHQCPTRNIPGCGPAKKS